jgi:ABC-type multidrug transport system fused ATPase/permease subunit
LLSPSFTLAIPLVEKWLIDDVLVPLRLDLLPLTLAVYAGLWLLASVTAMLIFPLRAYLSEHFALRVRQQLFAHCEALSVAFSHREHSGRTMALFVNDVPSLSGLFGTTVFAALTSVIGIAIGAALMFILSWQLAIVLAVAPPLLTAVGALVTHPLRSAMRRAQEKTAELSERLQENLAGIREIVAFGREHSQGARLGTTLRELLHLRLRVTLMDTAINSGQSLSSLAITMIVLGYGGYLVIQGQTALGTLIAMRTLFDVVFHPATQMLALIGSLQKALASADRIYTFLDQKPRVQEQPGARVPRAVRGAIRFEKVSFAYQLDRPVLHDVSFTADPGQVVALVGPSGAGKSTLASLIARFYDPTAGRVLLDGNDLRDLTLAGLRSHIGIVFQDTFLFDTTIRENIAFGREEAAERDVVEAAHAANAWEFIERLPDGIDTRVGERGVQLSEGQKQRLAIARALLRQPRVLILDEPTSALDARAEHLLQSALDNLMRGRTTFVIAHRLATVQRADRILVLDKGRVVEQGTHAELLRQPGLYRELFELQFGHAACGMPATNGHAVTASRRPGIEQQSAVITAGKLAR